MAALWFPRGDESRMLVALAVEVAAGLGQLLSMYHVMPWLAVDLGKKNHS